MFYVDRHDSRARPPQCSGDAERPDASTGVDDDPRRMPELRLGKRQHVLHQRRRREYGSEPTPIRRRDAGVVQHGKRVNALSEGIADGVQQLRWWLRAARGPVA
jgi:hypothetical protein